MLRITHTKPLTLATLNLEGKLLGPWVDELRSAVAALSPKEAVCVNLRDLSFADARGIELLCAYRRDGIQLLAASPLIEGLLASSQQRATKSRGNKTARE